MLWEAGSEARAPCLGFSLRSTELRARQPPLVFPKAAGGQNAEQKAARWRDEWQGPPSLRLHPACRISPGPPLRPGSGPLFPTGLQSRPQVTQEAKCPSAAPGRQPAPHLPSRLLGKSCLHCEPVSSCREKTEETRSPRTDPEPYVSQGRPWPPVLPTNYYRVLSPGLLTWASQFSEFANLMISFFFFFFKEDLFHLPLVNPCWKLLKSPDNGK